MSLTSFMDEPQRFSERVAKDMKKVKVTLIEAYNCT